VQPQDSPEYLSETNCVTFIKPTALKSYELSTRSLRSYVIVLLGYLGTQPPIGNLTQVMSSAQISRLEQLDANVFYSILPTKQLIEISLWAEHH
jgi:hypothetical protein